MALTTITQSVGVKKSESVLEFFNNLFSSSETEETERLENQFIKNSMYNTISLPPGEAPVAQPAGAPAPAAAPAAAVTAASVPATNTNSTVTNSSDPSIIQEWLRISSKDFLNRQKFPIINLPGGISKQVRVDSNNFRINDGFQYGNPDSGKNPLDFWFSITKNRIIYSQRKTDLDVLGIIKISGVTKNPDATKFCINIVDNSEDADFSICANNDQLRLKIFCSMKKNLGGKTPYECLEGPKSATVNMALFPKPTVIEEKLMQPIILIPLPSPSCNEKWDYLNEGKDWECTCKEGKEQSPINLPKTEEAIQSPVTPLFQYSEVQAKSVLTTLDGELKANEYMKIKYFKNALRIFHSDMGKIVTLDGAVYIAEEIVFHTPSEHTIDGKKYDMEMQVIHYGQTKGDISKQVVLSFLFQKKAGVYNKFIDDVDFFSLPNPMYPEREINNNLYIPKVFYSSSDDNIPVARPFSFYTYQGSITFPPCTERTIHYVVSKPIPIGSSSLQLIKEAINVPDTHDQKTGNIVINADEVTNARAIQDIGSRAVFYYDHVKYHGDDLNTKIPKKNSIGHYEKFNKKATEYFFVTGDQPSGIPNSFLVSENEAKGIVEKTNK